MGTHIRRNMQEDLSVNESMVPYIRRKNVEFVGENLKPYKTSKLFFDDVAVNQFAQNANKLVLDSKKIIALSRNNATAVTAADIVYQGSSNTVNTFSAVVDTFYSGNSTIVVSRLNGSFDDTSQLFIENVSTGITYANCSVSSVVNKDTADFFYQGEGIVAPERNNCYATVVTFSGENTLYVNKNYISCNVSSVGSNVIASMVQDFKNADLVYQTASGLPRYDLATFVGIVKYYNPSGATGVGSIAIESISGKLNANSTASSSNGMAFIWNASNTAAQPLGLIAINTADFAPNSNVQSVTNSAVKINVASWTHKSSVVANTTMPNTSAIVLNTSNGLNGANANLIYFVSGTGVGEFKRIVSVSGSTVVVNSALSFSPDTTTRYSIGNFEADQYGTLAGIFYIPSFSTFKFKSGERILTITDSDKAFDANASMRAAATYVAAGNLRRRGNPYVQPLPEIDPDVPVRPVSPPDRPYNPGGNKPPVSGVTGSSVPRIPLGDGLSQTFFTPKPEGNRADQGIFCTSIDLFFKTKPVPGAFFNNAEFQNRSSMQLPVTVKIAEVLNGYPTKNYLASKTIQAKDVKVSSLPNVSDSTTATKFTFDDPVYLEPSKEYAITIQSDSPDYSLYISDIGETALGSNPPTRISEQPYAGSLFRSQNSSTWTPYQNQDLMFVLNKAVFQSSGTATFNLMDTPTANSDVDRVMLISSDLTFPSANVNYRTRGVYTSNTNYEGGSGLALTPGRPIEYGLIADASGKSVSSLNRRRILVGNTNSYLLTTELSTTNPDVSPIVNLERLALQATTYFINNGGLSNVLISITNAGSGYNAVSTNVMSNVIVGSSNTSLNAFAQLYRQTYLANNANVGFYNITLSGGGPAVVDAVGFAVANTDGTNTINHIVIAAGGSGYIETPNVSIATGNSTSNVRAYAQVNGETDKSGGNMLARYISREIVLEDGFESGDLRVFMDAIRTSVNDIQVYYKVVSADDPERISSKRWRRMEKVKNIFSKDGRTMVGLEFRPSLTENRISYTENGVNYPIGGVFKSFQIKVCMMSSDPSATPKIKNIRISAIPEG
jgi:hypothetical protein